MKLQHSQMITKIKNLETELHECKIQVKNATGEKNETNIKIKELQENKKAKTAELDAKTAELDSKTAELDAKTAELDAKTAELDSKTAELDAKTAELDAKTAELESAKVKINELENDLDKKMDAFGQIDKIIFRNNEYFDELKKELSVKIKMNEDINRLYEDATQKLYAVTCELDVAYKELETTKADLQLFKNDFILKTARFDE
jgi:chromosome segregation ATPase